MDKWLIKYCCRHQFFGDYEEFVDRHENELNHGISLDYYFCCFQEALEDLKLQNPHRFKEKE